MMKKVALVNPGKKEIFGLQEPLGLGFIASYLEKNGVDVKIVDELAGDNVVDEIENYKPHLVGVTATTPVVQDAYRILDTCRNLGYLTVMGGVHASVLPHEALEHSDIVVIGEGEEALLDIIKNGIKSGIVERPYIKDINPMPLPARHLMRMDYYIHARDLVPESYLNFVPPGTKMSSLLTSRGCPYDCIFCHNTWKGMPYRTNSPEKVIDEIKYLQNTYGVEALFFIEDNFFHSMKRVKAICQLMGKENINISWGANARVNRVNPEILELVKKSGCRQITFGFESGSQRILDVLNKKTTVQQIKDAVKACNDAGIIPQGTVMIGNPTETVEDVRMTQNLIKDCDITSVGVCITTPYPGTKLWDWCSDKKLIPDKIDWSLFDYTRVAIPACDTIEPEIIEHLRDETNRIIMNKRYSSKIILFYQLLKFKIFELIGTSKFVKLISKIIHFKRNTAEG